MSTAPELREFDDDELDLRLENARKELFNLRFQAATGRLDNSSRVGHVRREIARVLTVRRDREIGRAEGVEPAGPRPVARAAAVDRDDAHRDDADGDEEE